MPDDTAFYVGTKFLIQHHQNERRILKKKTPCDYLMFYFLYLASFFLCYVKVINLAFLHSDPLALPPATTTTAAPAATTPYGGSI